MITTPHLVAELWGGVGELVRAARGGGDGVALSPSMRAMARPIPLEAPVTMAARSGVGRNLQWLFDADAAGGHDRAGTWALRAVGAHAVLVGADGGPAGGGADRTDPGHRAPGG